MDCPQCGTQTLDDEWNCQSCRMNVYWASQHYADLANMRLGDRSVIAWATPAFLLEAHRRAMEERDAHGGRVEHKVRQVARRTMQRRQEQHRSQAGVGVVPGSQKVPDSSSMAASPEGPQRLGASSGIALECTVGMMAYNEEDTIADALHSVLSQRLVTAHLCEVIVVASGCEDRTIEIVSDIARRDPRVKLLVQAQREGKASAINLFLGAAHCPLLVMVSADVVVDDGALETLVGHFSDPTVGMAGGRPVPVNSETGLLGHAVHLQWRLHDRVARKSPKLGEIVAFRNLVPAIPPDTAVDELSIQALISQLGYRLVYEPRAVVYNRGPATVRDFFRQRRRIHAGHLETRARQGYAAPTSSPWRVARALWGSGCFSSPGASALTLGTILLEATARALGRYDVARHRSHQRWEVSATTKRHVGEDARADGQYNLAVFRIVNFHHYQRDLGAHAGRQLTRRVADHIGRHVGTGSAVMIRTAGTIVVRLPGDREKAESIASEVIANFVLSPPAATGHDTAVELGLACGIIAFPRSGPPLVRSLAPFPLPMPSLPVADCDRARASYFAS